MKYQCTEKPNKKNQEGYITLLSVLILSVVALSISVTLLATGITTSQNSLTLTSKARAKAFMSACTEKAIDNIRADDNYTGTVSLTFTNGDCGAVTTDIVGGNKRIESTGTSGDAIQREETQTQLLSPNFSINFRRGIDEF